MSPYTRFLSVAVIVGVYSVAFSSGRAQEEKQTPLTGRSLPGLEDFDEAMTGLIERWNLPGGQLAVAKDGQLKLSRGYGYANLETKQPVAPDSLFRIGSVSKTFTAVALLRLVEAGHLRLEDRAFEILSELTPPTGAVVDPRIRQITIQQLLQHEGGWESKDFLELPWSRMAAATLGERDPPDCSTVIRYALSVPLDYTPGAESNYSNFGYCVLAQVIEAVAAKAYGGSISYEDFVRQEVLSPSGVRRARLGGTRLSERAAGEVRYYAHAGQPLNPSVFPGEGYVPFAYGGFYMKAGSASGGWIASTEDLIRFVTAIDGQRGAAVLKPATSA